MLININKQLFPKEEAKISVYDHGFMYGDGVFETMRTYNGSVFKFDEHINRLLKSADEINFRIPWSKDELVQEIQKTLVANKLKEARIRLTITRGVGELGLTSKTIPTLVIIAEELKPFNQELYTNGIKIVTVNLKRAVPKSKSCNYMANILAKQKADIHNAFEAILCNGNEIKEGTTSNVFIIKGNKLITPKEGIIKGITREVIISIARNFLTIEEREVKKQELYEAKEVFITSTIKEIIPVTKVDNVIIGNGKVGLITAKLIEKFKEHINVE